MDGEPYIVAWSTSEAHLRATLAGDLPGARVLRRMSRNRLVVLVPPELVDRLTALPEVRSVVHDELRRPDTPGGTRSV